MERRDRISERSRVTSETKINLTFNVDGTGSSQLHSGIPFFDHMLSGFAKHGIFDMTLNVEGDLEVDCHHTIEDTGIVLGEAIKEAVGDKRGIKRYGHFILPMDETLVLCAIDLSGRPYLSFEAPFTVDTLGSMDTEMVREFFYTVSYSAGMNLHLKVLTPGNNHHMAEALFKAFGKALDMASSKETRALKDEVMSTKGSL
ncbi:imidazoleglycerol-phosphate dehydratase HisB [Bariatricus massiliensis]|uniref:Imidazoleglycerol-phosphate dehydratase n=1 Tax=Bariatricus massiliensis TaxID=1745713 RepID=A0ABS8DCI8_9FIRM|nr:imidazoleglycerol-phosphate dehydratase HisB [Bariatricus massiliensis]MCB7303316.1 imidazoleglycerol-phosphate dehydratase HisB [Bariatricus massiliensis]MCB7373448.1 imidazoleglycerol-phosphate dehydratase HisB [Bariatricus massiliensis]MCB7386118.1 imidazoleglycerol-phosphate dehydratase HisB [Bariatricus massiliensis]MCB7410280.1 imidazoleglycerol-phosphate dehydratase HisB [Bariatricus massiliensis]MCQ5252436.1 imidazoleglycerol-phosphate dehydratase HisB [Bariatricus massiliensis]